MTRRKGAPCACECDPCKGKNSVRTINNISPDPNGDFIVEAGSGIALLQSGDNSLSISFDPLSPGMPTTLVGYGITDAVTLDTPQSITGIKTLTEAKTSTRAYSAANTTDIVTIGSLASNPNVVHTIGNETISGAKTFTGHTYFTRGQPYFFQKDTSFDRNQCDFNGWYGGIQGLDKNGNFTFIIAPISYGDDINHIKIRSVRTNASNVQIVKELDFVHKRDDTAYLTSPHRDYSSASNDDVLVKSHVADMPVVHLTGNENIAGNKTFTGNDVCGTSYYGITSKKAEFSRSDRSTDHRSWFRLIEDSAGQNILSGFIDILANGANAFNLSMDIVDLNGVSKTIPILYIANDAFGTVTTVMVGGRLIS